MKTFNFNETEGFNFGVTVLSDIQEAYSIYSDFAKVAGDKAIISGCEDLGLSIGDGFVFINGEILAFKGAVKQSTLIVKEEVTQREYENGSQKPYKINRYATFGYSTNSFLWSDFKRITPLNTIEERLSRLEKIAKPILEGNSPILFLKPAAEIPPGYIEWTGAAGRTLIGRDGADVDFNTLGATLGSKTVTLQKANLPSINLGTGVYTAGGRLVDDSGPMDNIGFAANGSEVKTELLGSGMAFKTLDPYRIVNYIIFNG